MRDAIASRSRAAEARRPYVWAGLAKLARDSDAAQRLLDETRASATARVLERSDERKLARDLGRLNATLGDANANALLFDQLPRAARAQAAGRRHLGECDRRRVQRTDPSSYDRKLH